MAKYWIGVASKDHVMRGVKGGFAMLNHGKLAPLKKMKAGDYLIYYSPKLRLEDKEPLQSFVALGRIKAGEPYQVKMSDDFNPYRIDVDFLKTEDAEIRPLIDELEFIEDKTSWGYKFRFGHVEIGEGDFKKITKAMRAKL